MASTILLVLTIVLVLAEGHAPRMREIRNPDVENVGAKGRPSFSLRRIAS